VLEVRSEDGISVGTDAASIECASSLIGGILADAPDDAPAPPSPPVVEVDVPSLPPGVVSSPPPLAPPSPPPSPASPPADPARGSVSDEQSRQLQQVSE